MRYYLVVDVALYLRRDFDGSSANIQKKSTNQSLYAKVFHDFAHAQHRALSSGIMASAQAGANECERTACILREKYLNKRTMLR